MTTARVSTARPGRPPLRAMPARSTMRASPVGLAVVGLTVLAAVLRFAGIGHQGFWFDEGNTSLLVHLSLGRMLGLIPQSESTPPLYYLIAWVWARVFEFGEAALRSLSAVAGVALVPVVFAAARKLVSVRAGLVAAALTACNPFLIWYSQEARSYSLLALLSAGTLLAFAHVRAEPTRARIAAWVLVCVLALATHYYAVLAVAPQGAWLLARHRRRRDVLVGVGLVAVCGLALVPLAISQNGTGHAAWIATTPLSRRLGPVIPQFLLGFGAPANGVLKPLIVLLAAFAVALALTRTDAAERGGALVAGGLAVAGTVLILLLVGGGVDDLISRNMIAIWAPAAVLVAAGTGARRASWVGLATAAAICGIGLDAAVDVALNRNLQRPDWRVVARVLGPAPTLVPAARGGGAPRGAVDGRAILVQHYRDLLPLSLYEPRLRPFGRRGATVSELDVVSFTSPPSQGFCWWGSACNLWPSRMQARYGIPGFHPLWRRHALQFTILRLVSPRPVRLTTAEVAAALRTTRLRNDELLVQS